MGYNLLINGIYYGYNPLILTFDPNFLGHPSVYTLHVLFLENWVGTSPQEQTFETTIDIPSLKLSACTWKLLVGRRSFQIWDRLFSGAFANSFRKRTVFKFEPPPKIYSSIMLNNGFPEGRRGSSRRKETTRTRYTHESMYLLSTHPQKITIYTCKHL